MPKPKTASPGSSAETTLVNTPESSSPGNTTPEPHSATLEDLASKAYHKIEEVVLYAFHEAPLYQQDNHFILNGYRGQLDSFKRCFDSLWYLHNETGMLLAIELIK
jgi:hypothetical protein